MFQHKFDQKIEFLPVLTFSIYSPFWGKVTKVEGGGRGAKHCKKYYCWYYSQGDCCVVYFDQLLGACHKTKKATETWKDTFFKVMVANLTLVGAYSCFVDFSREITEKVLKEEKGWKRLKKNISTSFWVHAAPKSWSKYTTGVFFRKYCF